MTIVSVSWLRHYRSCWIRLDQPMVASNCPCPERGLITIYLCIYHLFLLNLLLPVINYWFMYFCLFIYYIFIIDLYVCYLFIVYLLFIYVFVIYLFMHILFIYLCFMYLLFVYVLIICLLCTLLLTFSVFIYYVFIKHLYLSQQVPSHTHTHACRHTRTLCYTARAQTYLSHN